jgi:hypothetical protein
MPSLSYDGIATTHSVVSWVPTVRDSAFQMLELLVYKMLVFIKKKQHGSWEHAMSLDLYWSSARLKFESRCWAACKSSSLQLANHQLCITSGSMHLVKPNKTSALSPTSSAAARALSITWVLAVRMVPSKCWRTHYRAHAGADFQALGGLEERTHTHTHPHTITQTHIRK